MTEIALLLEPLTILVYERTSQHPFKFSWRKLTRTRKCLSKDRRCKELLYFGLKNFNP